MLNYSNDIMVFKKKDKEILRNIDKFLSENTAECVLTAGADDISWAALEAGVGYQNSSTSTVPGTTNTDLGNLTDASQDAFGIASSTKYDLMDPIGSLVSLDLGAF